MLRLLGALSAVVGCVIIFAAFFLGIKLLEQAWLSGGLAASFFFSLVLFLGGLVFLAVSRGLFRSARNKKSRGYELEKPLDRL